MKELDKLITRLRMNRITTLKLSEKPVCAVIRYCGEDKNWHILLSQRGTKFSDTEHNQWISRSPLVQVFNLKKNFVTQTLLELKNDIVGMRLKKKIWNKNHRITGHCCISVDYGKFKKVLLISKWLLELVHHSPQLFTFIFDGKTDLS